MYFPYRQYRLVRASWRDVFALNRLEKAVFPADAYGYFELLTLLLWPRMVNLKVVGEGGALAGFAAGGQFPVGGKQWIMTIGIHPDHQRQGLAWRLPAEVEARLPAPTVYLTVRRSNDRAHQLYLRNGYRDVQIKPRYYPDGETGIEMRKDRG